MHFICLSNNASAPNSEEINFDIDDTMFPVDVQNSPEMFEVGVKLVSVLMNKTGRYTSPLAIKTNIVQENTSTQQMGMAMLNLLETAHSASNQLQISRQFDHPIFLPLVKSLSPYVKITPIIPKKDESLLLSRGNVILILRKISK